MILDDMLVAIRINQVWIMMGDDNAITAHSQVELDHVNVVLKCFLEAFNSVLGCKAAGAAVTNDLHTLLVYNNC